MFVPAILYKAEIEEQMKKYIYTDDMVYYTGCIGFSYPTIDASGDGGGRKMKYIVNDFIGKRYGDLTVIGGRRISEYLYLECVCVCGNIVEVRRTNLTSGKTTNCGCKSKGFKHLIKDKSQVFKFDNISSNNSSGYVGVDYDKRIGKYRARVTIMRKTFCLGYFDTPQQANDERKKIVKILDWVVENLKNKNTVGGANIP